MKSTKVLVAIALAVFMVVFATTVFAAPIPNTSILTLDQGVGSATNTPCSSGSCFAMEVSPGFIVWTDFGPGTDGGIIVGKAQLSGGQELGGPSTDGELSNAWSFFSNNGTFYTSPGGDTLNIYDDAPCSGPACIGKTVLGAFNVAWNGSIIPLGSAAGCALSNCSTDQMAGIFVNDWQIDTINGIWSMNYSQVVPSGAFANVKFSAIMKGIVVVADPCVERCNDNNVCTDDSCDPATGVCIHTNNLAAKNCNDNNVCTDDFCNPATGVCIHTNNFEACNDGNDCTVNDVCSNGVCIGAPISGQACNDGNACTLNDTCSNGVCRGIPENCDDGDACTVDDCTGACIHNLNCGLPGCSLDPRCLPMPLPNGSILTLDQGVGSATNTPCSSGSCFSMEVSPGFIVWTDFGPGTDGGIMVGKAQLSGGQETQSGAIGTDGELSAIWSFFSNNGTFFTAPGGDTLNIFDSNSCIGEVCIGKTELKAFNVAWNGNIIPLGSEAGCTLSNCSTDQLAGIFVNDWQIDTGAGSWSMNYSQVVPSGSFANVKFSAIMKGSLIIMDPCASMLCDDSNPCTDDTCITGACVFTPKNCDDYNGCTDDSCNASTGLCVNAANWITRCNDNNVCTTDGCTPATGACTHVNAANGTTCDDNNACTSTDRCTGGVCAGTAKNCNDNKTCTADDCTPATGACTHIAVANGTTCDDNNACTSNDFCWYGACNGGTSKNCNDNNACTDDSCDRASGACVYTPGCDDHNACTTDSCDPATGCAYTSKDCNDNNACTADTCDTATGACLHTATSCPAPLPKGTKLSIIPGNGLNYWCSTGSCWTAEVSPGIDFVISIGPGTDSGFIVGKAQASGGQEAGSGAAGTDGELTNAWSFFSNNGTFFTAPDGDTLNIFDSAPCSGADCIGKTELKVFNMAWNGEVVPFGSKDGCTLSSCSSDQKAGIFVTDYQIDPVNGGAWSMSYSSVAPSGQFAGVRFYITIRGTVTLPDPCADAASRCNDNNVCTADLCNEANGDCIHIANSNTCDDGNACTVNDVCSGGVCVPGPYKNCDDSNICTTDVCIASTGCTHVNNTLPCNDNNAYTLNDTCSIGVCKGTNENCNDNNVCTTDTTDPATGACTNTLVSPTCGLPGTPLPVGTKLLIEQGVGSGINTPCTIGSCFSSEVTDMPGVVMWTDIGPGTDGGIVVGKAQLSGGQELASSPTNTTPGELTAAWIYNSTYGTFFTAPGGETNLFDTASCVGADCIGKTELKVWNMAWNGGVIPVGSAAGCMAASCTPDERAGIFVRDYKIDPVNGGLWSMNYSWAWGTMYFNDVRVTLIIRGTVVMADPCATMNCADGNICTDDSCLNGVCSHTPNTVPCSDGNACTVNDVCFGGVCIPGPVVNCDDGNVCTDDSCNPATGCVHTNNTAACNDGNACTVNDTCSDGVCAGTPKNCDDGNVCTTDFCNVQGQCGHVSSSNCDPQCAGKADGTVCSDFNACTVNDTCSSGVCVGTPINCDDGNVCTTDTCDTAAGTCIHTNITGCGPTHLPTGTKLLIEQGVESATNTPCAAGSCFSMEVGPGFVVWTDFGPGTDGGIVVGKSQLSGGQESGSGAIGTDGELSNIWSFFSNNGTFFTSPGGDTQNVYDDAPCAGAACIGKTTLAVFNVAWNGNTIPLGSDSGCVLSSCTPDQQAGIFVNDWQVDPVTDGLWSLSYSSVIPSGSFANVKFSIVMRGMVVMPGNEACDDFNVCTTDTRDPATGNCIFTPNNNSCTDHNACTTGDVCSNGACLPGTPINCDDGNACTIDTCNPATGCMFAPKNCNDFNVCTTDSCDPATGNCVYVNNTVPCNDGNACTLDDACAAGVCVQGAQVNCDDNNVCTTDTCDPAIGCVHVSKNCSDNNPCTYDTCDAATGACVNTLISPTCGLPGTPLPTGTLLGIEQGAGSATNTPCATGSCFSMEVGPGFVVWTDFGPGTDGGIIVGKAQLSGGQETGTGAVCTDGELSNAWSFFSNCGTFFTSPGGDTQNIFDSNSCSGAACIGKTELKVLNAAWNGGIYPMGSATPCVLSSCTEDQRNGIFVSNYQIDPDTGAWSMNYSSVLPSGEFANIKFSTIMRGTVTMSLCSDAATRCNDNNICTIDSCNPTTGACVHTVVVCDDNNICTTDSCNPASGCIYDPIDCNDNNACTTDLCDPIQGCLHTPIICNDYNACTTDTCNPAIGCIYTPISCDDGDACTADACDPATGACVHTALQGCDLQCAGKLNGTPCSAERFWYDPSVCYNDYCSNGVCVMGNEQHCNDNNTCTSDLCDQAIGVCTNAPLADGSPCTLDSQPGSCTAGQCIPYPACPAGSVKQVLVRGGGQKPSGADLQIETSFTVMNAGCIVDSSASSVTCSAGTVLQVNVRAGQGPDPTSVTWQSNSIATDTNFMITCTAGEVYKLDLDNKDAGGKDVDRITIYVQ